MTNKTINCIKERSGNTPFYCYNLSVIEEQIQKLNSAFSAYSNFELFYAMKANYSDIVLKEIRRLNIGIAVSSAEELNVAIKYNFPRISFTAPTTSPEVIKYANQGLIELNLNTTEEAENNTSKNLGLRINPEIGWSFLKNFCAGAKDSQFGATHKEIHGINLPHITRLHMHTSSDNYNVDIFSAGLEVLLSIAEQYPNIDTINLGGGIAVPILKNDKIFDLSSYSGSIINLLNNFKIRTGRALNLQIEPGNFIVRPSAYYVCKIINIHYKNNTPYYFSNGTKNHLRGIACVEKIHFNKTNINTNAKIIGCTCQKSDVLYHGMTPQLKIDDLVIIPFAGAYCMVKADNFHLLPKPHEYSLK